MPIVRVHFLPELVAAESLGGSRAVVVDVLRATTTIVEALAAGAAAVAPCLTIEDARARAAEFAPGGAVLGGERGGRPIAGFDLGNSPAEYTADSIAGRTLVLTTTNGTKAMLHAAAASEILIGALVNVSAVCRHLRAHDDGSPIDVLCAGTDGRITREDVLFAGAVVERLGGEVADDQANLARDAWRQVAGAASGAELQSRLIAALAASRGGQNLIEIGMAADIELAARVDCHALVPRYLPNRGRIEILTV